MYRLRTLLGLAALACLGWSSHAAAGSNAGATASLSWSPTSTVTNTPSAPINKLYIRVASASGVLHFSGAEVDISWTPPGDGGGCFDLLAMNIRTSLGADCTYLNRGLAAPVTGPSDAGHLHYSWANSIGNEACANGAILELLFETDACSTSPQGTFTLNSVALLGVDGQQDCALTLTSNKAYVNGCTPPPKNMVAWWMLDEGSGTLVRDMVGGNDLTTTGTTSWNIGTYVGNSMHVSSGYASRTTQAAGGFLDLGTGDFSIDAWVRGTGSASGTRTIFDKRQFSPDTRGVSLYLSNGRLGVQLADGLFTNWNASTTVPFDGAWHHVAATVKRASNGGTLYVDGAVVLTFSPTTRPGSLTNTGAIRLGQASNGSSSALNADIDEVEVFKRALSASEIDALYRAGSSGKCKDVASLPSNVSICSNRQTVKTNLTICNYGGVPATYSWSMAGLPSGTGCTVAGPTVFSPASGVTGLLAAGQCVNIPIVITRPAGLTGSSTACYQAVVTNLTTQYVTTASGSMKNISGIFCWWLASGDVLPVTLTGPSVAHFMVQNSGGVPSTVNYRLSTRRCDGDPSPTAFSINGLPAGDSLSGSVLVPANDSVDIAVPVTMPVYDAFGMSNLVLSADTDDDGQMEDVATALCQAFTALPTGVGEPSSPDAVVSLSVGPTPFVSRTGLRFSLGAPQHVQADVLDANGRLVRSLQNGLMSAGPHEIGWDGRDEHGGRAAAGVYYLRLQDALRLRTVKVIRLR